MSLSDFRVLTFDVYGTLIDWETGILNALQPSLDKDPKPTTKSLPRAQILDTFHSLEAAQQAQTPSMPYSSILTTIHAPLLQTLGLENAPTQAESQAFGESVAHWPAFPDTVDALNRLRNRYKLVVLSNVDRESFAKTNAGSLGGVTFDLVITAQDVGSYKPALGNFEFMLRAVEERFGVPRGEVLQTAQSQFHDHRPAREVGIKSVWIERKGGIMGNVKDGEEEVYDWRFGTLGEMADAVDTL